MKKKGEEGHVQVFTVIEGSLFPSFPPGGLWGGMEHGVRGVCQSTDGLYFDYGAFVVMGDGREGRGHVELVSI